MRDPDFHGAGLRRAWRLDIPPITVPDHAGTLAHWLVNAPGDHAFWTQWIVALLHLRPIEGASRPPFKRYPAAEFELMSVAADPHGKVTPENWREAFAPLSPTDWVVQFDGVSDGGAIRVGGQCIRLMMSGGFSPDTDCRRFWIEKIPQLVLEQAVHERRPS